MKELSLNILDLAQNSLTAGARNIEIEIRESIKDDLLYIKISDDGSGMDQAFLARVTDPFVTTRTTRPVGMGIPFFKMQAEMAQGNFEIKSEKGKGTQLWATFGLSHVDRLPIGDTAGTMIVLIQGSPDVDFVYIRETDSDRFEFQTKEIREVMGEVPLNEPEVLVWIRDYITQGEDRVMAQRE
ncbi:MAG: ATP-binding protein [Clostridia bacterium]|nr:ATP-binding protein [Clostridia bacterium]